MQINLGGIERAKAAGRDAAVSLVVGLLAAGFAVLGLGFLVAAGYVALAAQFGSVIACLILGAAFLALAALIVAVRFAGTGNRPPPQAAAAATPPPPSVDPVAQMAFEITYGLARAYFSRRRNQPPGPDHRAD
jgi:hypothetical protein